MKLIPRTMYLNQIKSLIDKPDIKIITGIRRCGKSQIMLDIMENIKTIHQDTNIIYIDFNLLEYESLKEYHTLNDYIISKYEKEKKNYLFIDEVQECFEFEKVINSIYTKKLMDIYLTGSNAFLLSSDIITLFTGRYIEIKVYPFSFQEFCVFYDIEYQHIDAAFDQYVQMGGMAGSYVYDTEIDRNRYLNSVYATISKKDIVDRYQIKDIRKIQKLTEFLMDNIGNLTSSSNIANNLSKETKTNHITVSNYLSYLCNVYLFYEARRYDIQGKEYLKTSHKYYISDHGLRMAILGKRNMDYGRTYENIVFVELLRRGYEVYVGKLYQKEIDFVAKKREELLYIQVSDDISSESTLEREISSLLKIKDAYPKLLIARTKHPEYSLSGIKVLDIAQWLLSDETY